MLDLAMDATTRKGLLSGGQSMSDDGASLTRSSRVAPSIFGRVPAQIKAADLRLRIGRKAKTAATDEQIAAAAPEGCNDCV